MNINKKIEFANMIKDNENCYLSITGYIFYLLDNYEHGLLSEEELILVIIEYASLFQKAYWLFSSDIKRNLILNSMSDSNPSLDKLLISDLLAISDIKTAQNFLEIRQILTKDNIINLGIINIKK